QRQARVDGAALKKVRLFVHTDEQVRGAVDRLRRSQEHVATRIQREVHQLHHALLGGAIQVDQEVPARHEIQVREGRILDQVVVREQDRVSQILAYPVDIPLFDEKPLQ